MFNFSFKIRFAAVMGVKNILNYLLILICVSRGSTLFEGEDCVLKNEPGGAGKCLTIEHCPYAKQLLQSKTSQPEKCGFNQKTVLVCCPSLQSTFEFTSTKSDEKCQDYHDMRNVRTSVAHGVKAKSREFPHMVALGYGTNNSHISWLCGGSLISDRFVLTAAHCTKTLNYGDPRLVRLGDLILNDNNDDARLEDHTIEKIFVHPNFKPPSHYNDIALIKLEKSVRFNLYIKPACLNTEFKVTNQLEVIGWGQTDFLGDTSNHLLKASLNVVEHKKCAQFYSNVSVRKLSRGINKNVQICAGDSSGRDTCPGDSGGPLHYLNNGSATVMSHFVVVGVTSFGKACGFTNSCGVYTRVSHYRSWIEKIVWPTQ